MPATWDVTSAWIRSPLWRCAAAGVANLPASGPHHDAVASGSLLSCAGAVHALRLAPGRTLITDVSTVASCAVVFERSDA